MHGDLRQEDGNHNYDGNNRPDEHKLYSRFMLFITFFGQLPIIFQILRILRRQSAGDISLLGLSVGALCLLSWLIYSLLLRDRLLILSNILGSILLTIHIIVTIIYR